jgi:hypothetical protein
VKGTLSYLCGRKMNFDLFSTPSDLKEFLYKTQLNRYNQIQFYADIKINNPKHK